MATTRETVLEIDLGALEHNYHFFKSRVEEGVKMMAVVKAFAYGSEAAEIAHTLSKLRVDYFAVAYAAEGIYLREKGIEEPILVLHPQAGNFEELIDHCLEPAIYGDLVLREFLETAQRLGQKDYPFHLKLNTGLNRLGFSEQHLEKVMGQLQKSPAVKMKSVFSHLAASEDWREREFTVLQIDRFRKMSFSIIETLGYRPLLHLCNTSGIINYPEAVLDMVRAGIGLYGFGNDPQINKHLRPIGTLKTIISQIQELQKDETVGYNRAYKASGAIRTATIPIGHADGLKRQYGNERAGVLVNGQYAPIIGNVCMDITMINVTGIDCEEGDEVIVFGGPQHAVELAKKGETISYELITGISQRVKRKIIPAEAAPDN